MKRKLITGFDHPYNGTINNERYFELPLAFQFLKEFPRVVEVGAVSPYYMDTTHRVIDPFDPRANIKMFGEHFNYIYENVLSISTVEHFGNTSSFGAWFSSENPQASSLFFEKLLKEAKSFLVTIPINAHPVLDVWLKENLSQFQWFGYIKRQQSPPIWDFSENADEIFGTKYAQPFECANSFIVLTKGVNFED